MCCRRIKHFTCDSVKAFKVGTRLHLLLCIRCAHHGMSEKLGVLCTVPPIIQRYFARFGATWEKRILAKAIGIQKKKRKLGIANHFPQTVKLRSGKEMPLWLRCFKALYNYCFEPIHLRKIVKNMKTFLVYSGKEFAKKSAFFLVQC